MTINRKEILYILTFILAFLCLSCNREHETTFPRTTDGYIVAAYVWPSCHDDSLAHKYLWSEGTGEWEIIRQGDPRFEGHYQPKQPLWGYEMDNDPAVVEKWIDTAVRYGVNTFIYDWYWYMDGPYLESALNDGFLKAANRDRMNFYIMWANHTVAKNYWNCRRYGDDSSLLFSPLVDMESFKKIADRIVERYFVQPNYLKIDNCPVMAIFDYGQIIESFGSVEEASGALDYFRSKAVEAGFDGIHFQMNPGGGYRLDGEETERITGLIDTLGIGSIAFYNMGGFSPDYLKHGAEAIEIRNEWDRAFEIPVFPTVSVGWDDTPRFPDKGADDVTRFHNTPESFASYLSAAKDYADAHPDQPRIIVINAWNEWVEGSYLLPDRLNGFGYLEAVKRVFTGSDECRE